MYDRLRSFRHSISMRGVPGGNSCCMLWAVDTRSSTYFINSSYHIYDHIILTPCHNGSKKHYSPHHRDNHPVYSPPVTCKSHIYNKYRDAPTLPSLNTLAAIYYLLLLPPRLSSIRVESPARREMRRTSKIGYCRDMQRGLQN